MSDQIEVCSSVCYVIYLLVEITIAKPQMEKTDFHDPALFAKTIESFLVLYLRDAPLFMISKLKAYQGYKSHGLKCQKPFLNLKDEKATVKNEWSVVSAF